MENSMTEQSAEKQAESSGSTENDVPVLITSVGEQLRSAREQAGLQLSDVAQVLKLGIRQLEALENGDWNGLPGATFIRGFVRNYARHLGMDPAPLMTQLDSVLEKPKAVLSVSETSPAHVPYNSSGSRENRRFVLIGVMAAVIATLIYFLLPEDLAALRQQTQAIIDSLARQDPPADVPPAAAPATPVAGSEPVFPPGTTPQQIMNPQSLTPADVSAPAGAAGVSTEKPAMDKSTAVLSFEIVRESWIEVRDREETVIFSQRLLAGSQKMVSGHGPLSVVIGYAPGVKLLWRGQPVELEPHTRGEVARLVLE